jgi:hypothetical protein
MSDPSASKIMQAQSVHEGMYREDPKTLYGSEVMLRLRFFAQAGGPPNAAFFVLYRRRRRPSSRAQCPVGCPYPPPQAPVLLCVGAAAAGVPLIRVVDMCGQCSSSS